MRCLLHVIRRLACFFLILVQAGLLHAQLTNVNLRVMSANLNGNTQNYQPFALRIFQGLKPDVVAIQEFNYSSTNGLGNNTPAAFREMIDAAFGTNFTYTRETGSYNIPNGVISRYPIIASGQWTDSLVSDRGFAWAQIDLPGSNDLYVVSVHLYSSGTATDRNTEATAIKTQIQNNFPAGAWVVVAGDFNTSSRSEAAISTFSTFLSDSPIPADAESGGNPDTNEPRNKPYDYVLPSFSMTNALTNVVFASHSFSNGLVFDSRVYSPLSDLSPVLVGDSGNAQHMAVLKDFTITLASSNSSAAPFITAQPQSQTVPPGSNATFSVSATGAAPLNFQWRFNGADISGASSTSYTRTNAQAADAGGYTVVVTNAAGSVTSSVATLVVGIPPSISMQPASTNVNPGSTATFMVVASGTPPPAYQWRYNGFDITGATESSYTRSNVQAADGGNYSVVVTNVAGSVASAAATLTVNSSQPSSIIAQWNFNSTPPGGNVSTGVTTPSIGSGTASLVGGTTASFATGDMSFDPAGSTDNSGWNVTTYPGSTANNKSAGVQFAVSTVGKQNLTVYWTQRASNTGSKYSRLQYSTNGTTFIDFSTPIVITNAQVFEIKTNNLAGIASVNNNPNFAFRIVTEFESTALTSGGTAAYIAASSSSSYAGTGTERFDIITVMGSATASSGPPAPAVLSSAGLSGNQFRFTVIGSAGSNYVVQATTNLASPIWASLSTNASPFSFTNPISTFPVRFYRAMAR